MDKKEKEKASPSKDRYVPLNNLKVHTKVDVYGVVKFFKPPYKTRGSDYCTMVSIVDTSYSDPMDKLKCLLFAREANRLPLVKLGQIIRFHRLAVSEYMGSLQGQNSPGFSWLLFSGDVGAPLEPLKASSDSYTLNDLDKQTVEKLRRWSSNIDELHEKLCNFNDASVGSFFDLVCQVVYTSVIEDNVTRLFKVWDGTQCLYDVRHVDSESGEQGIQKNDALIRKSRGCTYDVCVFDDHFRTSRHIKPGDYVKFINLHAAEYKTQENKDSGQPVVEFVLHRGDSFGRSVRVLSPDDNDLDSIKQRQSIVALENDNLESSESLQKTTNSQEGAQTNKKEEPVPSTSRDPGQTAKQSKCGSPKKGKELCPSATNREIVNGNNQSTERCDSRNDEEEGRGKRKRARLDSGHKDVDSGQKQSTSESEPICMVQTCTVVISHPNTKRSQIQEVLEHDVPYKFRVRARVVDYHPKANSVKSFLKLYCSQCHYLCTHPATDCNEINRTDSQLQVGSTFKGIPHFTCPQCLQKNDSLNGLDSPPHLQFIYMLRLVLGDDTGMLMANIWKEEAVKFFQDSEPEDLLKDESRLNHIKDCLNDICPLEKDVKDRQLIECCLQSYSVLQGTGYQIFDTVVV